jgi:hypothetical protein
MAILISMLEAALLLLADPRTVVIPKLRMARPVARLPLPETTSMFL